MINKNSKRVTLFLFAVFFSFLFLSSFTSAYQVNELSQITVSCVGFNCSLMNITVYDPDSLKIINNQPMTSNSYYANYSFTPIKNGNFPFYYSDGTNSSAGSFEVTPSGSQSLTTFLFVFLVIISLTFILAVSLQNNWFMFFGFLEILFFGFWIILYGIDIIKNQETTWAIGLILWGMSIIGMFKSVQGMLAEGGWK